MLFVNRVFYPTPTLDFSFRAPSCFSHLQQPQPVSVVAAPTLHLYAYSDSTWASDPTDHGSVTGYCILCGSYLALVQRQNFELLLPPLQRLYGLQWLLADFGIFCDAPTPLLYDNTGAIQIANDP